MRSRIQLSVALLLLSYTSVTLSQTIRRYNTPFGSLSDAKRESFSSLEGRYKIALPKQIGGFSEGTFQWRLLEGYFTVGYTDSDHDVETSKNADAKALSQAEAAIADFNRWLLESPAPQARLTHKTARQDDHLGVELRGEMPNGLAIARSFVVRKRIYSLAVMLVGEQVKNEALAIEVFNSFQVTPDEDADAILRKKIADATPKPLPQEPVTPKLKSDAEDENLKGRVKTVFEEIEGLSGRMAGKPRRLSSEYFYDESGNKVKSTLYNSAGLPFNFTVYGYIDGKRVSNSGHISYESSPPAMGPRPGAPPTAAEPKPRDPRYAISDVHKYGEDGKLSETVWYRNDGTLGGRTVYKHSGNQLETLRYSADGRLSSRSLAVLDDKGNEAEKTYFDAPLRGENEVYRYAYEFDARGNWIKCTTTLTRVHNDISRVDSTYVIYRKITYY